MGEPETKENEDILANFSLDPDMTLSDSILSKMNTSTALLARSLYCKSNNQPYPHFSIKLKPFNSRKSLESWREKESEAVGRTLSAIEFQQTFPDLNYTIRMSPTRQNFPGGNLQKLTSVFKQTQGKMDIGRNWITNQIVIREHLYIAPVLFCSHGLFVTMTQNQNL